MDFNKTVNEVEKLVNKCMNRFESVKDADLIEAFKKSLTGRFENTSKEIYENTYLRNLEIPQIILFDILANKFPIVIEAQNIIGRTLLDGIKDKTKITILDLGIGRCIQAERLLHLIDTVAGIQSVTLIGVDISKDCIDFTGKVLKDIQDKLHFKLEYHLLNQSVETIDQLTIQDLMPQTCEFLFVNASLTLHHIQTQKERFMLFEFVSSLRPNLFTMIEPNTDFFNTGFNQRMINAFEHFGSLFNYINTLPLLPKEKKGLKSFFSNDLFDALAIPEDSRYEKYDLSENWISLATSIGLKTLHLDAFTHKNILTGVEMESEDLDYVNFSFNNSNILGVIAFSA